MRFDPILDFVAFAEIIDNPEIVWECCSCVEMTRHKSLVVFLRDCEVHGRTWHRPLAMGADAGAALETPMTLTRAAIL
jgi:hypothetical protein